MKKKGKTTFFSDPDFRILHYRDNEESLFIAIYKNPLQTLTLDQLLDKKVRPELKSILGKEINGCFDLTYSFDMDERHVLFNFEADVAVCNLECVQM